MSRTLHLRSIAEEEISSIAIWYESELYGLGSRFLDEIEHILENISDLPLMYPLKFHNVRRALLTKFPYAIYYSLESDEATILAVRNTKQNPANLPSGN